MNGLEPSAFSLGNSVSTFKNRFRFTGIGRTVVMFVIVDSTASTACSLGERKPAPMRGRGGLGLLVAVVSKSTAVSSAVSGDGALSSGSNAGGADREGGEATESGDGAAAGRLVLPGDDAFVGDVVVGPTVDRERVLALEDAE